MKTLLREVTPVPIWNALRYAKYFAIDQAAIYRRRPPRDLIDSIGGSFDDVGDKIILMFEKYDLITPHSSVLEIGCGIGRVAVPLTRYLSPDGRYSGLDIVRRSIQWCQNVITKGSPNFTFQHADIFNKTYNQSGRLPASEFRLPYFDTTFDFVFLTSVFTHMLQPDVENYVAEISRVMKPGAKCLSTWFLLNDQSLNGIREKCSILPFDHKLGDCLVANAEVPEVAVAYKEDYVRSLHHSNLLEHITTIYGSWCGRTNDAVQDVCIYKRTTTDESFAQTAT